MGASVLSRQAGYLSRVEVAGGKLGSKVEVKSVSGSRGRSPPGAAFDVAAPSTHPRLTRSSPSTHPPLTLAHLPHRRPSLPGLDMLSKCTGC